MVGINFYKGQQCFIKPLLCQEGFCNECAIYLEKLEDKVTRVLSKISIVERQKADTSLAEYDHA